MATLQDVLALARRGVPVFPLRPGTKDGYVNKASDHGATTNLLTVYEWFKPGGAYEGYNFGCGGGGRFFYLDVDAEKGGVEAWHALAQELGGVQPTFTVQSARGGGFHLYFEHGGEHFSQADLIKGKINVRADGGYVVGPGSTFYDPDTGITGIYRIVDSCEIATIPEILRQRLRIRSDTSDAGQVVSELDTAEAIAQARRRLDWAPPAIQGQGGDNYTYKLACALFDYGLSVEKCCELMREMWDHKCSPPWGAELQLKVQNAWNHRQSAIGRDNPRDGFTTLPNEFAHSLMAPVKAANDNAVGRKLLKYAHEASLEAIRERQSRALVRGLIHPGELLLMVGEPASGKSFLMLDMSYAIAQGRDWHGHRTQKAPVLYVCAEGVGGFDKRILAATDTYGLPGDNFALLAVPVLLNKGLEGHDGALTVIEAYQQLAAAARSQMPGMIVVDTKSRATAGDDENSAADTMTFIEQRIGLIARTTGAAVAVVHHPNKDGGIRGSSSLEGAAEVVMRASRGENGSPRSLHSTKVKDGEEGLLFHYNLASVELGVDDDGVPVTSCIVDATAKGELSDRERQCFELTKEMMSEAITRGDTLSPKNKANNYAAKWLLKHQTGGSGFTKDEFEKALKLISLMGLQVVEYSNKGDTCARYELAHPFSAVTGASHPPAHPAPARGTQPHAPEPKKHSQIQ